MNDDANFLPIEPAGRMEILLVEDELVDAKIAIEIVETVLNRFPGSIITLVQKLHQALSLIKRHAPNIVLLDLSFPESTMENTLKHLEEIESQAPLVILTGHDTAHVRSFLPPENETVIVEKRDAYSRRGWFFNLILDVVTAWRGKRRQKDDEAMKKLISRMREISKQLHDSTRTEGP